MPYINKRTYKPHNTNKELGYKKDKEWSAFYGSRSWKTLRDWYIREHPLCENCLRYDITTPADEIHHRTPFRLGKSKDDKWKLFLDPNNLMSLCKSCHLRIHKEINNTKTITDNVIPEKLEVY